MDADAKQVIHDELLRRGHSIQEFNRLIVIAGFLKHAHSLPDVDKDHLDKARAACSQTIKNLVGIDLYKKHLGNKPFRAEELMLTAPEGRGL